MPNIPGDDKEVHKVEVMKRKREAHTRIIEQARQKKEHMEAMARAAEEEKPVRACKKGKKTKHLHCTVMSFK